LAPATDVASNVTSSNRKQNPTTAESCLCILRPNFRQSGFSGAMLTAHRLCGQRLADRIDINSVYEEYG
jgi:hypothetical protein